MKCLRRMLWQHLCGRNYEIKSSNKIMQNVNFLLQLGKYDKASWERTFEVQEQEMVRCVFTFFVVVVIAGC